jgi:phosphotransferase system enzyme I (PtsI)
VLECFQGKPVVVRLFDFGGDKEIPDFLVQSELNPSLGLRAIRLLLKEQELLRSQLKALHRADCAGQVKILLPMVSTFDELNEVKKIIGQLSKGKKVPLGCMVEVPSMALMADSLTEKVDFLSIGTNDLSQFVMGADRTNPEVSHLYTAHHPSVLRMIDYVVKEANKKDIPLSICGEIAADARFTPLLLGLGLRELSVHTKAFAEVRRSIRNTNLSDAKDLALRALQSESAKEVENLLFQQK